MLATGDWFRPPRGVGLHSWGPQGKNSFALLGWVVTHSLAWQPARWKGKCQTISGCKNKPPPGPSVKPPDNGINSPLSHSFRPKKKKQEKKLCGCMIPPSVTRKHGCQNHPDNACDPQGQVLSNKTKPRRLGGTLINNNDNTRALTIHTAA